MKRLLSGGVTLVCAGLAVAATGATGGNSAPRGFATGRPVDPGRVVCAVLPERGAGLYCAARGVRRFSYDGLGVVRLLPDGGVFVVRSGNDLLLAIDGVLPRSRRPLLAPGSSWRFGPYRCRVLQTGVDCKAAGRGVAVSSAAFQRR